MEKTAASSDALKLLLQDLKKQNDRALAAQLLQVKFNREIAGEDDDKREKQLAELIESSLKIEKALLGMNRGLGKLTDKLQKLPEFSKIQVPEDEMTLKEGLSELVGGIKGMFSGLGDKAKSVFETLKSPEKTLQAAKSGLTGAGEYISDIASAEVGFTTESDRFATERIKQENESRRKSGQTELTKDEQDTLRKESRQKFRDVVSKERELKDVGAKIEESKKYGFTPTEEDIVSKKRLTEEISIKRKEAGVATLAPVDRKPEEKVPGVPTFAPVERKPEEKEQGPNPGVTGVNPEADNIQSAQEIIADSSKQDVELTKEIKKIQEEQLAELKQIRQALAPKTPAEAPETTQRTSPGSSQAREEEGDGGGIGLGGVLGGLGALGKKAGRVLKSAGRGALSLGAKALRFVGSRGGMIAGGALAVGAGAYSAYKGYTGAEEEKQAGLQAIEAKVQSGEITPEEAEVQKKQLGEATVEKKGGAIGEGTGMAAGAIGGMKAGALLGATLGSAIPVVGTAIGAGVGTLAGGALGAFTGSKLGKSVGEFGGRLWTGIKNAPESMRRYNEIFSETDKNKGLKPVESLPGTTAAEMINAGVDASQPPTSNPPVESKGGFFSSVGAKIKGLFGEARDSVNRGTSGTMAFQNADQEVNKRAKAAGIIDEAGNVKDIDKYGEINRQVKKEIVAADPTANRLADQAVSSTTSVDRKSISGSGLESQDTSLKQNVTSEKTLFGSKLLGSLFSRKGIESGGFLGTQEKTKSIESASDSMMDAEDNATQQSTRLLGKRVSGGLFGRDQFTVNDTQGNEVKLTKSQYQEIQSLVKENKIEEANSKLEEIKSKQAQDMVAPRTAAESLNVGVDASEPMVTASSADLGKYKSSISAVKNKLVQGVGSLINATSTENADLSREASRAAPVLPPMVNSSVSNNNTTSYVPIKSTPRPEYTGSALDRYQSRVAVY